MAAGDHGGGGRHLATLGRRSNSVNWCVGGARTRRHEQEAAVLARERARSRKGGARERDRWSHRWHAIEKPRSTYLVPPTGTDRDCTDHGGGPPAGTEWDHMGSRPADQRRMSHDEMSTFAFFSCERLPSMLGLV